MCFGHLIWHHFTLFVPDFGASQSKNTVSSIECDVNGTDMGLGWGGACVNCRDGAFLDVLPKGVDPAGAGGPVSLPKEAVTMQGVRAADLYLSREEERRRERAREREKERLKEQSRKAAREAAAKPAASKACSIT